MLSRSYYELVYILYLHFTKILGLFKCEENIHCHRHELAV